MNKKTTYIHKVKYYETDKMGITHHSNYVRWMEEARIEFLRENNLSYKLLEKSGIISPVLAINCSYTHPTDFDDEIIIETSIKSYSGVRLEFEYVMKNSATGGEVFSGTSKHCFLGNDGKPVILKKQFPEYDKILKELCE